MTRESIGRGAVRISAGRWKGRRLEVPESARPTSARAREALFDILGPRVAGARFLDLYAGSGAVGFEAVSRGALRVVLVDMDAEAGALRRNAIHLAAGTAVEIFPSDASRAVAALSRRGEEFDIVFCDPPYAGRPVTAMARDGAETSSGIHESSRLVASGGLLVLQRDASRGKGAPPIPPDFERLPERRYGRNVLHFFARILAPEAR